MRSIKAFPVANPNGKLALALPSGSRILSVQLGPPDVLTALFGYSSTDLVLYAEVPVEPMHHVVDYLLYFVRTNDEVPQVPLNFLGSVIHDGIALHVYEGK